MKIMFLDESGDHGLDKAKIDKSYPMKEIIEPKFHRKNGSYNNCGLKIFP